MWSAAGRDLAGDGEGRRGPGATDLDRALPPCLSMGRAGAHPAPVAIAAAEGPSAGGSLSAAGRAGGGENRRNGRERDWGGVRRGGAGVMVSFPFVFLS